MPLLGKCDHVGKVKSRRLGALIGMTLSALTRCVYQISRAGNLCTSASDIRLQPCAARLIDPDPPGGVAGYINDQQLVLISDARFQSVAYLARSMSALHDPNCFKVMPPRAKRLYGVDEAVICSTSRRVNVIGDKYGGHTGACFHQTPQRLMFRSVRAFLKEFF